MRAVTASSTALERVLVADASSEGGTSASQFYVVKGACSSMRSACAVACRSVSDKVKFAQQATTSEGNSIPLQLSAQKSVDGEKAEVIGSSVDSPLSGSVHAEAPKPRLAVRPASGEGSAWEAAHVRVEEPLGNKGGRRRRRQRRSKQQADSGNEIEANLEDVVLAETGTQTDEVVRVEGVRRSERLRESREKVEKPEVRGFLRDRITGLELEEKSQRLAIIREAWRDFNSGERLSLAQYLKIAGLVCEGYLQAMPSLGFQLRNWGVWERYVKDAEFKKYRHSN